MVDHCLDLPEKTLVCGEIVKEYTGESRSQIMTQSLHIIDGIVLNEKDIRSMPLYQRNQQCMKFVRFLKKQSQTNDNKLKIRCKRLFKLTEIEGFFDHLVMEDGKDFIPARSHQLRQLIYAKKEKPFKIDN